MQNQIDTFTEVHINPIVEQVKQIDAAVTVLKDKDTQMESDIKKLQAMKGELEGKISDLDTRISKAIEKADENRALIEALEATRDEMKNKLNSIDASIEDLEKRVGTLEEQIKELETFRAELAELNSRLGEEIQNTKEWTEANFVSLEEYQKTVGELGPMIEDLKELKATLGNVIDYIPTIERRFDKDEADIEALWKEAEQIRKDYAEAIKTAHDDVLDILDKKVEALQNWVISAVADTLDDYYTIAKTDQLLANLKATIEKGYKDADDGIEKDYKAADTELLNKIEGLRNDLNTAKSDIEAAYKKAIQDVADEFDKKYKDQGAKIEGIEKRLTSIETEIKDLGDIRTRLTAVEKLAGETKSALESITGRVNSLEQQAEAIREDIKKLQDIDGKVNKRIDSLGKAHLDSLKDNIRPEIDRLKQADVTLNNAITDLQNYVDGDLTNGIKGWANQTFSTLEREKEISDSLAGVFNFLGLEPDGMGGWVSSKFNGYYTIAQVDAKIDSIGNKVDTVAQHIRQEIADLRDSLTDDYQTYIQNAIEKGGIIDQAISDSVNTLRTEVNEKLVGINNEITELKARLTALENVVQSVVFVPEYDDGKIFIPSEYDEKTQTDINTEVDVKLRYKINTKNADFDPKNYTIVGDLIDAASATKVVFAGKKIEFKTITYTKEKGILECVFNTEVLPASFYDHSKSAAMSLCIYDNNTEISSAYIGLRLKSVTSGGGGGGGDEPVGSFRVDPSSFHVGISGGDYEPKVICSSSVNWIVDKIEYSSGNGWVDVQVDKNATDNGRVGGITGNSYDVYSGISRLYVMVSSSSYTEERTATITLTSVNYEGLGFYSRDQQITLKITQDARTEQTVTVDPEEITSGMTFDWEGLRTDGEGDSYKFTVTPSDQQSDWRVFVEPQSAESWVVVNRERLSQGAGLVTVTANARTKGLSSYYKDEHKAKIVVTPSTGGQRIEIPVEQGFRPDGKLIFNPSVMEVYFDWNESGSGSAYRFTISPEDQLREWNYQGDTDEFKNFDKLFSGTGFGQYYHDGNTGESDMTVYPKEMNKSFTDAKTGIVTFVSASGQSQYPMTFIQDVRPGQELEFDKDDTSVDFTWDQYISGTTSKTYTIKVSPKDKQGDWPAPTADADWISVSRSNVNKTDGSATVSISVKSSVIEGRNGKVTIKSADGKTAREIAVNQLSRPEQTITITSQPDQEYTIDWKATKEYKLTVTSSDNLGDWKCDEGDAAFKNAFTVTVGSWNNNQSVVTISAKEKNTSLSESKSGKITFTPATGGTPTVFTFTQSVRTQAQILDITPSGPEHSFTWKQTDNVTYTITVHPSDDSGDWECETGENFEDYFTINGQDSRDGSGNATITVNVKGNNRSLENDISSKLTFKPATGGTPTVITFKQTKCPTAQTFTSASPADGSTLVFKANKNVRGSNSNKDIDISVTTSDGLDDWTYEGSDDWIDLNKSGGKLTVSVNSENKSGSNRTGTVTIYSANGDATLSYTVTQAKDNLFWSSVTKKIENGTTGAFNVTLYNNMEVNGSATVSASGLSNNVKINNSQSFNPSIDSKLDIKINNSLGKLSSKDVTFTIKYKDGGEDSFKLTVGNRGVIKNNYYIEPAD